MRYYNMLIEDTLKSYSEQMEEDLDINIANVMLKQMDIPKIKHKWLYRLSQERLTLFKMDKKKQAVVEAMSSDSRVQLSKAAIEAKAKNSPEYKQLLDDITVQEILVEHIDTFVNKILTQVTYDIKNIVELIKIENL